MTEIIAPFRVRIITKTEYNMIRESISPLINTIFYKSKDDVLEYVLARLNQGYHLCLEYSEPVVMLLDFVIANTLKEQLRLIQFVDYTSSYYQVEGIVDLVVI